LAGSEQIPCLEQIWLIQWYLTSSILPISTSN